MSNPQVDIGEAAVSYFTGSQGHKIAYRDSGDSTEVVVLLHGFLNSGANWEGTSLLETLRDEGYRVIIPDLLGNGDSDHPDDATAYADHAEARQVMELLANLGIRQYTVLGYSRGATVAADLLLRDPRIKRAILGGMGYDFTNPEWPRRLAFAEGFRAGQSADPDVQSAIDYANSIDRDLTTLYYQQLHQPSVSPDELRSVPIPVLIVSATGDRSNGDPGRLERLFEFGKLSIVPGTHDDAYQNPVFAAAVMGFLRS